MSSMPRETLARLAPGTALRDGIERILNGRTGALIVLGWDRTVERLSTGGFDIGIEFSATRLRELAKLDGAIVVDRDLTRIIRAGVHLMPDPAIETSETGTRHRTAERVARQTGFPVVSVSQSMGIIGLYMGATKHVLEGSAAILARANQALQTLERYRNRLDQVTTALSASEIEAVATVREVAVTLQRQEMVRRISDEIRQYVAELGTDGRLVDLQLEELATGLGPDSQMLLGDYLGADLTTDEVEAAVAALRGLTSAELIDLAMIAQTAGLIRAGENLDAPVQPSGYRLLAGMQALPRPVIERLIARFGDLQTLMAANVEDLMTVDGVGEQRARLVRETLSRIAETSLLDRFS
ncbi:DNA integrity scanning protein DisA [Tersicoccus phoenicis]|uniref:DNA integrity scanning protein DisA n=1 Tax=Tersicoccus phoenicis TaxID=554083 RepID=A0A1R1LD56_9MICC|nr:DNA integrity scanning diadenylate cyclase DisA [Tersicoccus phoenicis]OMH25459.1 DNA integrity scanning protein DisA [Tersicoccus phoenicis]